MAMSPTTDQRTTRKARSRRGRSELITLDPTPEMAEAVDGLAEKMGVSVPEVMTQAVALLLAAVEAQERGERICFADDDLNVLREVVNFGVLDDEGGIDPPPASGSDRLDS